METETVTSPAACLSFQFYINFYVLVKSYWLIIRCLLVLLNIFYIFNIYVNFYIIHRYICISLNFIIECDVQQN